MRTVMVIDDNETDTFIFEKMMANTGFARKVFIFSDCEKAVSYFESLNTKSNEQAEQLPQYIFLDLCMPVMDGYSFLEAFHQLENTFGIKIIVLSVSLLAEDRARALNYKYVVGFLTKPLTITHINSLNSLISDSSSFSEVYGGAKLN